LQISRKFKSGLQVPRDIMTARGQRSRSSHEIPHTLTERRA